MSYIDYGCLVERPKMKDIFSYRIQLVLEEKIAAANFYSEKDFDFTRIMRVFQCKFRKSLETGILKNVLSIDLFDIQSASDDEALGDINITIRDGYAEVEAIGETFEMAAKTAFSQRCWASLKLEIESLTINSSEFY